MLETCTLPKNNFVLFSHVRLNLGSRKHGPWFGIDEFDIPNGYGILTSPHVFLQPGRNEGRDSSDANTLTMDIVTIKILHSCDIFVFSSIIPCISLLQ